MARRATVPLLLALLAVLALGGGWWLLAGQAADARPPEGSATAARTDSPTSTPGAHEPTPAIDRPAADGIPGARPAAVEPIATGTPGQRAFGRVVDRARQGVAHARITSFRDVATPGGLFAHTREPLPIHTQTDEGGRFELLGLPTDVNLGLEVRHPDFAAVELAPFTASATQSTDVGDIVLEAGLLLLGNVQSADGKPLAGADVTLTELGAPSVAEGGPEPRSTQTAADGEYRFDHLAPRQFTVEARHAGFAPRAATLALLFGAATGNSRQDFQLQPAGAAIAGRVRDADDRAVHGLRLRLSQRDRNAHDFFLVETVSDEQGLFRFDTVSQGVFQLEVLDGEHYLPKPLTVQAGDQAVDLRVQPARFVQGQLSGASGPPREFRVTIRPTGGSGARLLGDGRPSRLITGAEPPGYFEFHGLQPGAYRFEISADGYAVTTSADVILGVEAPSAEVLIELATGGAIRGRIAPPAEGVAVELRGADYDPAAPMETVLPTQPSFGLATRTDAAGAFLLEHVPAGPYTLTARAPGAPPLHVRSLEVVEGGQLDLGQLELPRGGIIFGNVLAENGTPSVGARVTALSEGQQESAVTDAQGAFRLPPLPAGEYELRAVPPGMWEALRLEAKAHVSLHAGEEAPVLMSFAARVVSPH